MSLGHAITLQELLGDFSDEKLPPIPVSGVCSDSRLISNGDVYVAIRGENAHGLDYLDSVADMQVPAVLVDAADQLAATMPSTVGARIPLLRIENLAGKLGFIASRFHGDPSRQIPVCGVTGTDGKTSVSRFVAIALSHLGYKAGYIGTIGWGVGDELQPNPLTTPDSVTLQNMFADLSSQGVEFVALEVSSHALVQGRVNGVDFDVAVLTNLGRDHLDYHRTLEEYRAAKQRLFEWPALKTSVLNTDDEFGQQLAQQLTDSEIEQPQRLLRYCVQRAGIPVTGDFELQASNVAATRAGLEFDLSLEGKVYPVSSALLGSFNVQNLLACAGVLHAFGMSAAQIVDGLQSIKPVAGRMECFAGNDGVTAVVDFAHTPQALRSAMSAVRAHCNGKLWVVFGCGGDRDAGKRPLMGEAAFDLADRVVVTDDNPRTESSAAIIEQILHGVPAGKFSEFEACSRKLCENNSIDVIPDRAEAIHHALSKSDDGDWVLIAGKGHEDYQIVGTEHRDFSDRALVASIQNGAVL